MWCHFYGFLPFYYTVVVNLHIYTENRKYIKCLNDKNVSFEQEQLLILNLIAATQYIYIYIYNLYTCMGKVYKNHLPSIKLNEANSWNFLYSVTRSDVPTGPTVPQDKKHLDSIFKVCTFTITCFFLFISL